MNRTGIELLRYAVHMLDHCKEDFNLRFNRGADLLKIADACQKSKWDFYPDQWDEIQIQECLLYGHTPDWDTRQDGKIYPVYLHGPSNDDQKPFNVGITWTMTATVPIYARNLDEAIEWTEGDMPLPSNGEYLDDSFDVDEDATNELNPENPEESEEG